MPPAPETPGILQRLRTETRPYHDALEATEFNQALAAGTVSAAATERLLGKLYGFLVPYEAELRRQEAAFEPAWEVPQRFRAHLIPLDLHRDPAAPGLPLCPAMPPLLTRPQLMGAMYVMEGSTLGGQVIARQLDKAGVTNHAYFTGYAERTGPLWKAFCQQLAAADDTTADDIVASASRTFQTLHAWITQP